ncbi:MAG: ABC transporter ATP-binding protein [Planctomycetes bacterium]|nr:ABC transporter ATP-binding protein [Planctomycetota bacterium]
MSHAITVEGLSKRYRIQPGAERSPYRTLRESLVDLVKRPWRGASNDKIDFWALDDVSFQVGRGEVLGVIGRNGAGKSTLLKVLSRITPPTLGQVSLHGRVGSLLEVGTGFHPELTGRENVFLNGAILGMSRGEIQRKFDDIVEFAGLHDFLETPVKRYSTGMFMRLAFSVAAHIQPEILLIDEVLAVGDVGFQKKCLGKMGEVAREGRTVLFVSHQMDALMNICPRSILLEQGKIIAQGPTSDVIERYFASQQSMLSARLDQRQDRKGRKRFQFTETWIEDMDGQRLPSVLAGQSIKLVATYETTDPRLVSPLTVSFAVCMAQGAPVTRFVSDVPGEPLPDDVPARGRIECVIPRMPFNVGRYFYDVLAESGPEFEMEDWVQGAGWLIVEAGDFWGTGRSINQKYPVLLEHSWSLKKND